MAESITHKWVLDGADDAVHSWTYGGDRPHDLHRGEAERILGHKVRTLDGDVLGLAKYEPRDGDTWAHVLIETYYDAPVPKEVIQHFKTKFPNAEVRSGHTRKSSTDSWEPQPLIVSVQDAIDLQTWGEFPFMRDSAAWALENLRKPSFLAKVRATVARKPKLAAEDGADMEGCMVALFVDEETAKRIHVEGGEDDANKHITLLYFDDKAADRDDWDKALEILRNTAVEHAALEGKIGGYGVFGTPDGDILWAAIDVPGLSEFKHIVTNNLAIAGFDENKQHGWTPHLTLKYKFDGNLPDLKEPIPIKFTEVTLAQGEEQMPVHFGGND